MSRSHWKGLFIDKKVLRCKNKNLDKKYIKTHSRSSAISAFYLKSNLVIGIYNGKIYKSFKTLSRRQFGYKLGEFAFTRKHSKSKKAKKKKTKGK